MLNDLFNEYMNNDWKKEDSQGGYCTIYLASSLTGFGGNGSLDGALMSKKFQDKEKFIGT